MDGESGGEMSGGETSRPVLGVVELLGADGQVLQLHPVRQWPLHIGRALDNDLLLGDPHAAPHHLHLEADADGALTLVTGATANGVQFGTLHLRAGERQALPAQGEPIELGLGHTRLRLRLPGHTLAPERPLQQVGSPRQRFGPTALAAVALLIGLAFSTWLDAEPDQIGSALGSMLLASVGAALLWCGAWALLSKTFTRRGQFGWHLRVFVFTSLAWLVLDVLPGLLAFMGSWPGLASFAFVPTYALAAAAFYFHLLAVEPARPRLLRSVAVSAALAGVLLTLWLNHQGSDRYGAALYLTRLFPPALRLAKPVTVDTLVDDLAGLQAPLDRKALKPGSANDAE